MSKFNNIIDPKTKQKVSIFGQEGGQLLAKYVNTYKKIRKKNKSPLKEPIKNQEIKELH